MIMRKLKWSEPEFQKSLKNYWRMCRCPFLCGYGIDREKVRIIRIKDTLTLAEFEISESLIPELPENMKIISQPYALDFNECGNLL